MNFTDDDIKRIKDASANHLVDVVQDFQNLRKSGTSYVVTVPSARLRRSLVSILLKIFIAVFPAIK